MTNKIPNNLFQDYIEGIYKLIEQGDAREESFYPTLSNFITNLASYIGKTNIEITILPKKTEAGYPDFRVWDGRQHIVGYIEAKKPGTNLDDIEEKEQLKRYRNTFPNLILTDFFEFRLYWDGKLVAKGSVVEKNKAEFISLLEKFFVFSSPVVYNAKDLAIELAKRTSFLRDEVIKELEEEKKEGKGTILGFYEAFKQYLKPDITPKDFADMYAQTITYGLFVARTRANCEFTRKIAYDLIPPSIGILRDIFRFISLGKLTTQMEVIIDDIVEVLQVADVSNILHEYYKQGKGEDPIIHFYETFLSVYDPDTRKKRGVYYTPQPVVEFIVRSVHSILKKYFKLEDGLASEKVTLLDPAAGTLTFLAEAIKLAVSEYIKKYGDGSKEQFIKEHLLKNFYAFELEIAPYVIGHIKINFLLEELGYKLQENDRFKLYLTNTVDLEEPAQTNIPGLSSLSEESHLANEIKRDIPILVIIGNPPYSVSSQNEVDPKTEFGKFYESYKENVRKEERNIQPLSDDYIKFIAFAHWKIIEKTKKGIIAMITNNSYLDGIIHRDMRKKLYEDFDLIYILNLHGDVRKGLSKDKKEDENVFDIQEGVAISIFVKPEKKVEKQVYYYDLVGTRKEKYQFLDSHDVFSEDIKWERLEPEKTFCSKNYWFFVPKKFKYEDNYHNFISMKDIFSKFNVGIATGNDDILVDFNEDSLLKKLDVKDEDAFKSFLSEKGIKDRNIIDKWISELKRIKLKNQIQPYFYRPFDIRFTIYNKNILQRARTDLMDNLLKSNFAIVTTKILSSETFLHVLVTNSIGDRTYISTRGEEANYYFPLWLYKSNEQHQNQLLPITQSETKTSNIKEEIIKSLLFSYKKSISPEEIFYYIYAVLYSNKYRQKYVECLKVDFPRIPFPEEYELFNKLSGIGKQLVDLHLLNFELREYKSNSRFEGNGEGIVEKVDYKGNEKRVYINETQYFTNVEPEVWDYYIGSYQVLAKWLKDRKGRKLSSEEIKTYIKIIEALRQTIKLQEEIDKYYPQIEENLIEWENKNHNSC